MYLVTEAEIPAAPQIVHQGHKKQHYRITFREDQEVSKLTAVSKMYKPSDLPTWPVVVLFIPIDSPCALLCPNV